MTHFTSQHNFLFYPSHGFLWVFLVFFKWRFFLFLESGVRAGDWCLVTQPWCLWITMTTEEVMGQSGHPSTQSRSLSCLRIKYTDCFNRSQTNIMNDDSCLLSWSSKCTKWLWPIPMERVTSSFCWDRYVVKGKVDCSDVKH